MSGMLKNCIKKFVEEKQDEISKVFLFGVGVEKWLQSEIALLLAQKRQQVVYENDESVNPLQPKKSKVIREIYQEFFLSKNCRIDIVISRDRFLKKLCRRGSPILKVDTDVNDVVKEFKKQKFMAIEFKAAELNFQKKSRYFVSAKKDIVKLQEHTKRNKLFYDSCAIQINRAYNYEIGEDKQVEKEIRSEFDKFIMEMKLNKDKSFMVFSSGIVITAFYL